MREISEILNDSTSSAITDDDINAVQDKLEEEGYPSSRSMARAVIKAGRCGCLLWTRKHIVTTDASKLNIEPRLGMEEESHE